MNRMLYLVLLGVAGASIILLQSGFLFMLLALMPSIVAYFIDNDPRKNSFKVVFSGNISAALPTLLPMLKAALAMKKFDISAAMSDPKVWLFIYLGAGTGWAIIYLCKFIARFVVTMKFEYQIKSLENTQLMLADEWGDEVTLRPAEKDPAADASD